VTVKTLIPDVKVFPPGSSSGCVQ